MRTIWNNLWRFCFSVSFWPVSVFSLIARYGKWRNLILCASHNIKNRLWIYRTSKWNFISLSAILYVNNFNNFERVSFCCKLKTEFFCEVFKKLMRTGWKIYEIIFCWKFARIFLKTFFFDTLNIFFMNFQLFVFFSQSIIIFFTSLKQWANSSKVFLILLFQSRFIATVFTTTMKLSWASNRVIFSVKLHLICWGRSGVWSKPKHKHRKKTFMATKFRVK